MARDAFLIVEDDEATARALGRLFGRHRPCRQVASAAAAREAFATGESWLALVVDLGLPDGSGLEVLSTARARWPLMPALVLTGSHQPDNINRSYALGAEYLCKPASARECETFIRRAIAREGADDARMAVLLDRLSELWALSPREAQLLSLLMADVRRASFPAHLGITENTTKTLVRKLLSKAAASSLDELARRLFRQALEGNRFPSPH
ncbi:MAG: response regulator transcription factor [Polyangiales bacterium]